MIWGVTHKVIGSNKENPALLDIMDLKTKQITSIPVPVFTPEKDRAAMEHNKKVSNRNKDERGPYVIAKMDKNQQLETKDISLTIRDLFVRLLPFAPFNGEPFEINGVPLRNVDIAKIWDKNLDDTKKALTIMEDTFGLIGKVPDKQDSRHRNYCLSDEFFVKGSLNTTEYTVKIFQRKLKEVEHNIKQIEKRKNRMRTRYGKKTIRINALGILHAVLPYFHYQTYYLCKNPNDDIIKDGETVSQALDKRPKSIKHLSKNFLCQILGGEGKKIDPRTLEDLFEILIEAGAVLGIKGGKRTVYKIHPDLMFRSDSLGNDEYTISVRNDFEATN
ncbi:hypothetical protein COA01_23300 [Bacillus cereus]|uniref:hypothetical protein n=1 Tax=Bacillus cereus TaxID=1396 RepID=UPI000BFC4163|nr:hypothetical protein [Bacillus cereus]PGP18672.1 hypothetical protein COA01_23300 [Bacillus cereus]